MGSATTATPHGSGEDSRARYIGTQGEAVLAWQATRNLSFEVSYAFFVPGQFIEETGSAKTVHFVGTEMQVRF